MNVSLNVTLPQLIVYLLIAAIVGLIAERLVGAGPWGLIGNIVVGLIGIWLVLNVSPWKLTSDILIQGIPIITAIIGAIIVDLLLSLLVRGSGPRRGYRRRY